MTRSPRDQSPRDRALEKLIWHEDEAKKLRLFLKLYDELSGTGGQVSDEQIHASSAPEGTSEQPSADDMTVAAIFASKDEIAATVRDILRGETEPMHINTLYRKVTERGLRISGNNPKGNLSAKLAPYKDIVYVRDRGWVLKETKTPPKDEAPNSHRLNGASETGNDSGPNPLSLPNSNPALRGT